MLNPHLITGTGRPSYLARLLCILIFPVFQSCTTNTGGPDETAGPPVVVVDASDLIDHLAREHVFMDNSRMGGAWLFNNSAIELGERETMQGSVNLQARVQIPVSGEYHVYARVAGPPRSSLRVAVGEYISASIPCDSAMSWKEVGTADLQEGEETVWITRVNRSPVLDVIALSTKGDLTEEDLQDYQYQSAVKLIKEYPVGRVNAVKFGDLDGDGRMDFLVLSPGYSASVYNYDGKLLWEYTAPDEGTRLRAEFEGPGVIWDLDNDGFAEVIHWRFMEGREWLVVADGMTGRVLKRVEWPCPDLPHVYNNFRIAIGRLHPGYPDNIIVFTDPGNTKSVSAYSPDLELLWQYNENRLKDHLGHYPYPVDLDGDGIDEVVLSPFVLDAEGRVVWDRFDLFDDNHDHVDSYRFADINGDGKPEALAAMSDLGVVVFEALTGRILWHHVAEHSQQIEWGDLLSGHAGPQIAVNARYYGNPGARQGRLTAEVHWFDKNGNFISKWPANPISGNPDFVKGDWLGDGRDVLFWGRFRMTPEGRGKLYFPETVYHMFDFDGNGADEVITLGGGWLRVWSAALAEPGEPGERDPGYLRHKITNHTHY